MGERRRSRIKAEWGYLLLGGLFLCNPIVAFVDVLPDAVGYLLLCLGLWRVGDLNASLGEARRGCLWMLAFSMVQLLAQYFLFGVLAADTEAVMNVYEQPMLVLLCSLAYATLVIVFGIPALRRLFFGLDTLALRNDAALSVEERMGKRSRFEALAKRSCFFVILQQGMSVLPELSILTSFEREAGNPLFPFDWYRFVPLFRMLAVALTLGVAAWWLIGYLRLFAALRRDTAWNERLEAKYTSEILADKPRTEQRMFFFATLCIGLGMLFSLRIKLNDASAFPSPVCALGLGAGLWLLREKVPLRRSSLWLLGGLAVSGLLQTVLNVTYLRRYVPEASSYLEEAYWHFLALRLVEVCEAILLLLSVSVLLNALCSFVKGTVTVTYAEDRALSRRATEHLQKKLLFQLRLLRIGAYVICMGNVAYAWLQLYFPWLWFINLLLFGIEMGLLVHFRSVLAEETAFYGRKSGEKV